MRKSYRVLAIGSALVASAALGGVLASRPRAADDLHAITRAEYWALRYDADNAPFRAREWARGYIIRSEACASGVLVRCAWYGGITDQPRDRQHERDLAELFVDDWRGDRPPIFFVFEGATEGPKP